MIGTELIEDLVQTVAMSHRVRGLGRVSLLLLARPESGKTTIAKATNCKHVSPIAVMSGLSIMKEIDDNPDVEFLLFNDLTAIRAMSPTAVNLLIVLLNQMTQDERGKIAFAGKEIREIKRPIGIIGCLPFKTFKDHRAKWTDLGFVSRMIPFAYAYDDELIAEIKDSIIAELPKKTTTTRMPRNGTRDVAITISAPMKKHVRRIADAKAVALKQIGIRLLQSYLCLVKAHALLHGRRDVLKQDIDFLRTVDSYVSTNECKELERA